jgi:PAS domain S-box-containing protein
MVARATLTRGQAIEPAELLEALLAAAPVGFGFLDADLRFIRLNAALASMHGVDRHKAVGQPYSAVWKEMPSDLAEKLSAALENGTPVIDHEARLQGTDGGASTHVLARFYPLRDRDGGIVGVGIVVFDITERTASQQAMQRSEAIKSAILSASLDGIITMDADGCLVELNPAAEEMFGYWAVDVIGREVAATIVPPSLRDMHRAGLARHLAGESRRAIGKRVELVGLRADGTEFPVEVALARIDVDERPLFAGSFRDITERKRAEAELAQRADEQAALRRVATLVASDTEAEQLFARVCEEVGTLVGADTANLLRYDHDRVTIVGAWSSLPQPPFPTGTTLPLDGDSLAVRVRRSGRPERLDSYDDIAGELATRIRDVRLASSVAAPVSLGGEAWGFVAAGTVCEGAFSAGAEAQLGRFAELLSLALANAEANRKLRESRVRLVESSDAERRRLERNLHDGAQQRLVALRLDLRVAETVLARDRDKGLELLQQAQRNLDESLQELRELARGLHPAILSDRGLGPALEGLSNRSAVPVELKMTCGQPLPPAVEAAFYYVASEALTNVVRYAQASTITIEVSDGDEHATLRIRDDGAGGARIRNGGGLQGLTDRVEALGGQLGLSSVPGEGTTVEARVPVRPLVGRPPGLAPE